MGLDLEREGLAQGKCVGEQTLRTSRFILF